MAIVKAQMEKCKCTKGNCKSANGKMQMHKGQL